MNLLEWFRNLSPLIRRMIVALGVVIIIGLLAVGYYFIFFAEKPEEEVVVNINGEMIPLDQLPDVLNINRERIEVNVNVEPLPEISTVAQGDKTLVSQVGFADVNNISLDGSGQSIVYYDSETGKFYQIDEDGNVIELSDVEYANVDNVVWGNSKDQAILEFPDESNIYYDFSEEVQYTLPKEMEDFSFAPSDGQIGFKYMAIDEEDRWLGVAGVDGSASRGLEQLGENADKVNVDWSPSGQAVATFTDYIDGERQQVGLVGLKGENFKAMTVEGKGFESQWAPDGQRMIYSVFNSENDYKPTVWVVDAYGDDIGKNRQELGVNTWVDKCAFSGTSTAYCAVPEELPRGAGFSEGVADNTVDNIYKINLESGQKTLVAIPSDSQGINSYTIDELLVSDDGGILYFKDKNTQKLNKINLK